MQVLYAGGIVATTHAWTILVVLHTLAASLGLLLGGVNALRRRRGDGPHRVIGWTWVALMYFVSFGSFLIRMIRPGQFSWIHALSALTIVTLSLGLWNARRGNIRQHAGNMIGTYLGQWGAFIGVVVVPTRLVPMAFQASWWRMSLLTLAVVGLGVLFVQIVIRSLGSAGGPLKQVARHRQDAVGHPDLVSGSAEAFDDPVDTLETAGRPDPRDVAETERR